MYIFYVIYFTDKENAVQAQLSGIFTHKGGSIAILSDNGPKLKNAVFTDACEQFGIKRLYSNPFHPQLKY